MYGATGRIRTHGGFQAPAVFKTAAIVHSATVAYGGHSRTRTGDKRINSPSLYQLSYAPEKKQARQDSNLQPTVLETVALPNCATDLYVVPKAGLKPATWRV